MQVELYVRLIKLLLMSRAKSQAESFNNVLCIMQRYSESLNLSSSS